MLYGVQGIGKSTWAASAPGAIFLPTEDGIADIDCASFPLITSFGNAIQALSELYSEKHDYQTLVIDSLDWLERLVWQEVCDRKLIQNIEDLGYGKGYVLAIDVWREILDGLNAIRQERNMGIILLAHSQVKAFRNPEADSYDRFVPRLQEKAAAVIQEWCDEVLFTTYKVHTKTVKDGFGQTVTRGIGTGDRVVKTSERPSHMAKNRLGLPEEIPLDWTAYASYFTPAIGD